jgi:hypothetical protein
MRALLGLPADEEVTPRYQAMVCRGRGPLAAGHISKPRFILGQRPIDSNQTVAPVCDLQWQSWTGHQYPLRHHLTVTLSWPSSTETVLIR